MCPCMNQLQLISLFRVIVFTCCAANKTEIRDENDEIVFMKKFHSVVLQNPIIILMVMF